MAIREDVLVLIFIEVLHSVKRAMPGTIAEKLEKTVAGSITIDNLDEATARWIEKEAELRGVDKESIALFLIQKGIECEGEASLQRTYDDLDSLAGTWTEEQAMEFMDAVSYFNQVDEKMWQ